MDTQIRPAHSPTISRGTPGIALTLGELSITGVDWLSGIFCFLCLGREDAGLPTLNSEAYLGRGDRITIRVVALSRQRQRDFVILKFTRTNFY